MNLRLLIYYYIIAFNGSISHTSATIEDIMQFNNLTPEEISIIEQKGTELPFSGEYNAFYANGFYVCRKCNAPLYRSLDKFNSNCGWPSFDDEITGQVQQLQDADGLRTEIICNNCTGHLGHVFSDEAMTIKNTRHCVNSLSIRFYSIEKALELTYQQQIQIGAVVIAGGCFWKIEYFFEQEAGVLATAPGFTGGTLENPTYSQVCKGNSKHAEAVLVIFDQQKTNVAKLYSLFFNIHNSAQIDGQGVDIGDQYRSAIFILNDQQLDIANKIMANSPEAVTQINILDKFWLAELEHHHYYHNRGIKPQCGI